MITSLRPIEESDHEWLVALHNDPEVLRNLTHPQPVTMSQHLEWWKRVSTDHKQARLVFCVDEERVGVTKFYDIDHTNSNCTLGADIHKNHRGKGHAKQMWTLMLDRCFNELKLHRVSLTTASFNTIGQHIYDNIGFKREGRKIQSLYRDGVYYDMIDMYMLRESWINR